MFFDRTKKALESGGTYEEFLKLLNLFAKDVIDTKTLIKRSEVFLTDAELMYQFKELMSFDDKRGNIDHGPPGSIRTSAPDPTAATCPDDDEGPSYRKLPVHVSIISFFSFKATLLRSRFARCDSLVLFLVFFFHMTFLRAPSLTHVFACRRKRAWHVQGGTSWRGQC